jgi:hypothetical protein
LSFCSKSNLIWHSFKLIFLGVFFPSFLISFFWTSKQKNTHTHTGEEHTVSSHVISKSANAHRNLIHSFICIMNTTLLVFLVNFRSTTATATAAYNESDDTWMGTQICFKLKDKYCGLFQKLFNLFFAFIWLLKFFIGKIFLKKLLRLFFFHVVAKLEQIYFQLKYCLFSYLFRYYLVHVIQWDDFYKQTKFNWTRSSFNLLIEIIEEKLFVLFLCALFFKHLTINYLVILYWLDFKI